MTWNDLSAAISKMKMSHRKQAVRLVSDLDGPNQQIEAVRLSTAGKDIWHGISIGSDLTFVKGHPYLEIRKRGEEERTGVEEVESPEPIGEGSKSFAVHIYAIVRVTVPNVRADNPINAVNTAEASVDLYRAVHDGEYADKVKSYWLDEIVDGKVVGDPIEVGTDDVSGHRRRERF